MRGETSAGSGRKSEQRRFQSTHPMRGETLAWLPAPARPYHFNPLTPCGVRRPSAGAVRRSSEFQSTHPMRGETGHEFLAGGDRADFNPLTPCGVRPGAFAPGITFLYFNPLTPCGVRLQCDKCINKAREISIHSPHAG